MAAGRTQMCKPWFIRNIKVIVRLKRARYNSVFSAGLTSYIGRLSKDKEHCRGRYVSCFGFVSCFGGTSTKSETRLCQKIYQLQSCKNKQLISSKWITTSTSYLNEKKPLLNGKRKLKEKIEKRESILTVPNLLSAFRIVAAPFLGYFIISEQFTTAAVLFGVAGFTDMLDGYIARNFKNQKSVFGTILDPIADKILMSVLTISLTAAELLPIPLTVLILSRDVLLVAASFYFRYKSLPSPKTISRYFDVNLATVELRPNLLGKTNTVLQLSLVGSTLLAPIIGYVDHPHLQALWFVVGASTVLSSISYLFSSNTAVRYLK